MPTLQLLVKRGKVEERIFPSKITPPPTPVPSVTITISSKFLKDITVQQAKSVTCMLKIVKNLTVTAAVADALNSMHKLQV